MAKKKKTTDEHLKYERDVYYKAYAKDHAILKGVHGALADIGAVVPPMDADLYATIRDYFTALQKRVAELESTTNRYSDSIVTYRNLAIALGARPDQMLNSYDRELCEKKLSSDDLLEDTPDVWRELETLEQSIGAMYAKGAMAMRELAALACHPILRSMVSRAEIAQTIRAIPIPDAVLDETDCGEGSSTDGRERCESCDKPKATDRDHDIYEEGKGVHLCWAKWGTPCEPEDWRARALRAERLVGRSWKR